MMTPERLAEIRAASGEGSADWCDPITDARDLLAEVDRLRAQVAAVEALADWLDAYTDQYYAANKIRAALASGDEMQP